VFLQILRLAVQRVRLARFLRQCEPGDGRIQTVVAELAGRLRLERPPRAMATAFECSPFVCGIARPTLVFPRGLAETLGRGELAQIVAHELAHVKRRDLVWGWIPEVARMIYFFHPVAHWAAARIRLERELACDQVAMHTSGRTPAEYAETLVHVLGAGPGTSAFRTSAAPLDGGAETRAGR
jgi:beta-lactamase regulating signal transducer with metallopeptidase domain